MTAAERDGMSILGLGAAACVACCAGPMLAVLGSLGIAGVVGTMLLGSFALVLAAGAVGGLLVARRRRTTACAVPPVGPVPVVAPTRTGPS